ncbi:MAG: laccase domain-containing protein [Candidatus Krumholzibacteria bacterium]|nr:laccase domain-containing protein [Candidatus Krumholzibacteria bacterium]
MEWIEHSGIALGIFPVLESIAPELKVFFTSRLGGVSKPPDDSLNLGEGLGDRTGDVRKNRRLILNALGISVRNVARAEQVHGAKVGIVKRGGVRGGLDGLVTAARSLTLVISTADCYPVIIYSPSEKVLMALHVGRSGAAHRIIERGLDILAARYRIDIEHSIALIGPGICNRCYTVSERSALGFHEKFRRLRDGRWHLDLLSFCVTELKRGGLKTRNIYGSGECTSCQPDLFFSHRRDRGRTGRHWTLAAISPFP